MNNINGRLDTLKNKELIYFFIVIAICTLLIIFLPKFIKSEENKNHIEIEGKVFYKNPNYTIIGTEDETKWIYYEENDLIKDEEIIIVLDTKGTDTLLDDSIYKIIKEEEEENEQQW